MLGYSISNEDEWSVSKELDMETTRRLFQRFMGRSVDDFVLQGVKSFESTVVPGTHSLLTYVLFHWLYMILTSV